MSQTFSVSTSEELYDALNNATGGDTILLAEGNYGTLSLNGKGAPNTFSSTLTIKSEDPNKPAVFDHMDLHFGSNITIDNVVFDYAFEEGNPDYFRPFEVVGSTNISITNSHFIGELVKDGEATADGYGTGYGLTIRDSTDIVVEGNEFTEWGRGLIASQTDNLVVSGNEVHEIRSDGLNFAEVNNVLIEDNYIHDFRADYDSLDHRDMIQFWSAGTDSPTTNVVIRNNTLDMGDGSYAQSIFMRNESVDSQGGGQGMYYQNLLIEGNTIYNSHLHGITVGETDGLIIRNNSMLAVKDTTNAEHSTSMLWVPQINVNVDARNVVIDSNVTALINGQTNQSDWTVKNNAFVQNSDPNAPGYYNDVFLTSSMTHREEGHEFIVKPNSLLDKVNLGSADLKVPPQLEMSGAIYQMQTSSTEVNERMFDATMTAQMLADAGISGATYTWDFGDGTTATGLTARHDFTYAGEHNVELTVTLPGGQTYQASNPVEIRGGQVLSFDGSKSNAFITHGFGEESSLGALDAFANGGILLGAPGNPATVSRNALEGLRGSDELTLDFTMNGETTGELFRLHMSYVAKVNADGDFVIQVFNDALESVYVVAKDVKVNDGQDHDISVRIEDGALKVFVDGTLAAEDAFTGTLPEAGSWDMSFGNPWQPSRDFQGSITEFAITAGDVLEPLVVPEVSPKDDTDTPVNDVSDGDTPADEDVPVDASLIESTSLLEDGQPVQFEGNNYVNVGRLKDFEDSQTLGFSVDFVADDLSESGSRLVWNHMKLGLMFTGDEIKVNAATKDNGFEHFWSEGLDLEAGEKYTATVLLDSENDRLQVIVNDKIVIDVDDMDFDHVGAGNHEWGWSLATPWDQRFDGEVSDFQVSDQIQFHEEPPVIGDDLGL